MQPSLQAGSVTGWGGLLASSSPFGKTLPVTVSAGSNKTLILMLQMDESASSGWTVKFNDVPMTLLYAQAITSNTTNSIWYLNNPPEGTFDAFVGVGSWFGARCMFHCSVWNDVDQTTPFGSPVSQSDPWKESPFVATISATADGVTLNSFSMYSGALPTITPGQTQLGSQLSNGEARHGVASYKLGESSSVTNSWAGGTSTQPAQLSVVLNGVVGGGATNATADGITLTGTATLTPGTATSGAGAIDATAEGVTLTGTATLTPGAATGGASGSFVSSPMYSSGILQASVALDWTWYPGAIGAAPTSSLVHGAGVTAGNGTLTVPGLSAGAGFLLAETADGAIYYEAGTVA